MAPRPLEGIRVVELGQEISGPFCAKLLAALGAEVIKVEPPEGDAARRIGPFPQDMPHPERSGLFLYLNTGKQGITLDITTATGRELFLRLATWADVVVENFPPSVLSSLDISYDTLREANPRLILTSITPFGQSGPYRDDLASEIGLHAISGEMNVAGLKHHQPLKKGGEIAHYLGGLNGFLGTMGALFLREQTGEGQQVDVSLTEGLTSIIVEAIHQPSRQSRPPDPRGIYPCKDGYIQMSLPGRPGSNWQQHVADIMGDPSLATQEEGLEARFMAWIQEQTKEYIYHEAQKRRLPWGHVATAPDLLSSPQLVHRGFFEQVQHPAAGSVTLMGLPFLLNGERWYLGRAPLLGEHNETVFCGNLGLSKRELMVLTQLRATNPTGGALETSYIRPKDNSIASMRNTEVSLLVRLPLEGVRVFDLTQIWAGPVCTRVLGDLGAEVIKLESVNRPDPTRGPASVAPGAAAADRYHVTDPGERPYNRGSQFNDNARNKLGITLDLWDAECRALARELVSVSDIVVENFAAGVMDRLGLGYEDLQSLRPDIILVSMQGFGSTGPEAPYVAMGPTQEAMSGLSSLTGYPGGPPLLTGIFYGDSIGGTVGAVAATAALWHRRQTGKGMHVDLSQREAAAAILPEVLLQYQFNGRILPLQGNRHPYMAPHGCYACKGEDSWIVIAVADDTQWRALCQVMGHPEVARDPRFSTIPGRLRHQDELDELITTWTQEHEHYAFMHKLQEGKVPAQAVLNISELVDDPQYKARSFFQYVPHPEAGTHSHNSQAWRYLDNPLPVRRPAPCLGEHNSLVLGELLGTPQETLQKLEQAGKIGKVMLAARARNPR